MPAACQMEYPEYFDYPAYQDQAEELGETIGQHQQQQHHQQQHYARAVNAHMPDQSRGPMYHPVGPPMSCDVKPRLTKEQHDLLEAHFQKQHKPTTNIKKGFADTLSVPLDKINNWFQNRRAKAKQDAKKAAGQVTLYGTQSQTFGSDSEPSPFQPSQQYAVMQHQFLGPSSSEEDLANGLGISQMPHSQPHVNGVPFSHDLAAHVQLQNVNYGGGLLAAEMYGDADMNRRTITQETFNEMTRHGGMVNGSGQFESLDMAFSGDQDTLGQVFAGYDPKQDAIPLGYPQIAQPLSSNDSTVPSVVSEQSMHAFPSSNIMQHHASMSAPGSDWTDSRSSSLASSQHGAMGMPLLPVQSQPHPGSSQWEPGQSVPINVDAMKDEFQQVATQANLRASMDQGQEQPLAYPPDDAYVRRGSTASMLAQSMGGFGLHTPQLDQSNGPFKQPPPPAATIAARRQKRTPANLGIASMRSQSFGGPGQPSSPGYQHNLQQGQSVRRVMSSNVLNGVVQGRVMKSVPGSAQRSPLNWTFNDAMNSPHLVRAVSHGNLAPPTPVTPVHPNQTQQVPNLPVAPGQILRQQSIGENEDQGFAGPTQYPPSSSVPQHVSPPHTPHYYQQPFVPYRIGSNVIVENTPPQSAPASQTSFPSNVFGAPPPPPNPHLAAMANAQQQQYLNLAVSEQPFQMSNVTFAPSQHATVVASGPAPGAPLTFATGVPVRTADGNVQMSFPAQMQMMQPSQSPPQVAYAFVNSSGTSADAMAGAQPPKLATQPASDFVVHEYSPPDSMKRSLSPRKVVDSGPRNYSFAHIGPVDFEEKRLKKEASSSPVSSNGTTATL